MQVGGEFTAKALPHMAQRARVSVCGGISGYNDKEASNLKSKFFFLVWRLSILIIAVMFIYIYLFGVRLHGIDRRKLEKNTGLPVLWIPL